MHLEDDDPDDKIVEFSSSKHAPLQPPVLPANHDSISKIPVQKEGVWSSNVEIIHNFLIISDASCHVTTDIHNLHSIRLTDTKITVADNTKSDTNQCGSMTMNLSGTDLTLNLERVYFQPKFNKKLLSVN